MLPAQAVSAVQVSPAKASASVRAANAGRLASSADGGLDERRDAAVADAEPSLDVRGLYASATPTTIALLGFGRHYAKDTSHGT